MPLLYHYAPLFHLPAILREGLRLGEIAGEPDRTAQAVSLTTQADPDGMQLWGKEIPFKTAVRFACKIPDGDARLEPTRKAWKRLRVHKRFLKLLDPLGQSKWWSFYHGLIPAERFAVQLRGRGGYVDATPEALARILPALEAEDARYVRVVPPGLPGGLDVYCEDPDDQDLWYVTDPYAADRFGLIPPAQTDAARAA